MNASRQRADFDGPQSGQVTVIGTADLLDIRNVLDQNLIKRGMNRVNLTSPGCMSGESRIYHVRVIERATAILEQLAASPEDLSAVDLVEKLGLHKSTIHRLLVVLERSGLVERRPDSAKYGLGRRLFELGMVAGSRLNLPRRAKPYLARLVEETGETAHLGVLHQSQMVSLVAVDSHHSVRTPATIGRRIPLHCTSQGKVSLAFLPPGGIEENLKGYVFVAYCRNTITSREQFLAELSLVRERGYAVDNEEFEEGLRCVAAPVRDQSGNVLAAISIAGPCFRVTGGRIPELSRAVMRAAADLSSSLGHHPHPAKSK